MSTRILLQHQTKYQYDRPVFLSPHLFRLKPAAHSRIVVEAYSFLVSPPQHQIHWQQDPFGNFIARADFAQPVQELMIDVKILACLAPVDPFDFFLEDYAQRYPFEYEPQLKKDLSPYLEIVDQGPLMRQWLGKLDRSGSGVIEFLVAINQLVFKGIAYTTRMQPGVQSSEESLEKALGSCRDSAWLLAQLFRNLGLAARFVSGYLVQLSPPESTGDPQKDTLALHAWTEVYIPGAGWIGLDPTSGLLATEGHIPLAGTSVPEAAAPVTGKSEVTQTTFSYSSSVVRF